MLQLLNEEELETLCYERCKSWSNFIKRCAEKVDGKEIDLHKIEKIFKHQDEASIVPFEEAKEEAVEQDCVGKNTTQSLSKTQLMQMLLVGDEDSKNILDQTLPIVEQHVRKWQQAGLDRILDTFDPQQIEQHVGDWLRRNNKAYGQNTQGVHNVSSSSCESEAESLHSVDTARYIRASRKRTLSMANKCSSPMSTIKMYRTLPRRRAELRAKYGCEGFKEYQQQRHQQRPKRPRDHSSQASSVPCLKRQQRRKQLRKRRDITDSTPMYSSSSSSEEKYECSSKTVYSRFTNISYSINYRCKRLKWQSQSLPADCCQLVHSSAQTWMVEHTRRRAHRSLAYLRPYAYSDDEDESVGKLQKAKCLSNQYVAKELELPSASQAIELSDTTTNSSPAVAQSPRNSTKISTSPPHSLTKRGILLHKPDQDSKQFKLTEQTLAPIIGRRRSRKFLKYHTGSCSYNSRCHVYYRPSSKLLAQLSNKAKTLDLPSSCTASDSNDEIFEKVGRYGVIQAVLEKAIP